MSASTSTLDSCRPVAVCPCGGTLSRAGKCDHARGAAARLVARSDHYERLAREARGELRAVTP